MLHFLSASADPQRLRLACVLIAPFVIRVLFSLFQ
jgi:hypothetical protein